MDLTLGNKIIDLRGRIASNFDQENWEEIGLLTGHSGIIDGHPRLLRSLSWNDEDYAGNVLNVLKEIAALDLPSINVIERYLNERFPGEATYISAKPAERRITFAPNVFATPEVNVELDLVAVMMPFNKEFEGVHASIKNACASASFRCLRADDIWEDSVIIQDIFNLIFRANIVVVDFTGKNPNVMYETGIAHTLGKHVVPISQSLADVPFDMTHHRVLKYLPNAEGLAALAAQLATKLRQTGP